MDTICAPEKIGWWVLPSRPFPIKRPHFENHGGCRFLHLLGRSSLLDHQETPGAFNGEKDGVLLPRNRHQVGCVIETWTTQNKTMGRMRFLNNEFFFVFPSIFPTFFHTTCGILWPVGCQRMSWVGDRRALWLQFRVFKHGLCFQLFGDYDIIIYTYDKTSTRRRNLVSQFRFLHGMTSDFHP